MLPVSISFRLPNDKWKPADPAAYGLADAAFLAVRSECSDSDYSPTIIVSGGMRDDDATLDDIADEAVAVFAQQAPDAELVKRRDYGTAEAPGVLQVVGGTLSVEGKRYDLRQVHVLLGMLDTEGRKERAVVKVSLSATYGEVDACLPEFQEFMRSFGPAESGEV